MDKSISVGHCSEKDLSKTVGGSIDIESLDWKLGSCNSKELDSELVEQEDANPESLPSAEGQGDSVSLHEEWLSATNHGLCSSK